MSNLSVVIAGQTFTYEGLFTMSGPELVRAHNLAASQVGLEPTKRFSDKVSAVKRTWAALSKVAFAQATAPEAKEPEVEKPKATPAPAPAPEKPKAAPAAKPKKEAAPKEKKVGKPRGKRFVFPQLGGLDEPKPVREGTHRYTLVQLMSRREGATFEELLAATWAKEKEMDPAIQSKTCYEAIRLIHYYTGYGMRQTESGERVGAIHLFFNKK